MISDSLPRTMRGTVIRPFWQYATALLVWQMASVVFGAGEAIYNQPAPPLGIVATVITVTVWTALGVWSGMTHRGQFRWFAVATWSVVIAAMLAAMWLAGASDTSMPWDAILLLFIFFAAVPLNGIASYLPLEQVPAVMSVAVAILALSLAGFHVGHRLFFAGRRPSGGTV